MSAFKIPRGPIHEPPALKPVQRRVPIHPAATHASEFMLANDEPQRVEWSGDIHPSWLP